MNKGKQLNEFSFETQAQNVQKILKVLEILLFLVKKKTSGEKSRYVD